MDKNLCWTPGQTKTILSTRVFQVNSIHSVSPDQKVEGDYIVLDSRDWVCVIPVLKDDFLMVQQWRHGEKSLSIEFPGGVIDEGETPEQGAVRELREETGYISKNLVYLGKVNPNPAIMANHMHYFLAMDLEPTGVQELDKDEYVKYLSVPQKEVLAKMGSEEYPHALMCGALLKYLQYKGL